MATSASEFHILGSTKFPSSPNKKNPTNVFFSSKPWFGIPSLKKRNVKMDLTVTPYKVKVGLHLGSTNSFTELLKMPSPVTSKGRKTTTTTVITNVVRGSRFKIIRRLGDLPGLTSKIPPKSDERSQSSRFRKKSQYRIRLEEKQKLRFHYGVTERQLLRYVRAAGKVKGSTGQVLLQLLEMRLDNIVFRLGMASTIPAARQMVNHRHVLVNGRIVNIPSYRCRPRDIITTKDVQTSRDLVQSYIDSSPGGELPKHLSFDAAQYKGSVNQVIDREWAGLKINELLVVEYYSRKI